jgi:hypothetical protein
MNDPTTTNDLRLCEARAEDISLLAAGCVTTQEEQEVRAHLATCVACRERFEQFQLVCSELRAAKPESEAIHFDIGLVTITKPGPQRQLGLLAAVVASVLVMLGLLSITGRHPATQSPLRVNDIAQVSPTQAVPAEASKQPTLLALRQAAAESDEALDRFMAQTSVPMFSQPLNAQSLWVEQ